MTIIFMIIVTMCNPLHETDCKTVIYGSNVYETAESCKAAIEEVLSAPGGMIMNDIQCVPIILEKK